MGRKNKVNAKNKAKIVELPDKCGIATQTLFRCQELLWHMVDYVEKKNLLNISTVTEEISLFASDPVVRSSSHIRFDDIDSQSIEIIDMDDRESKTLMELGMPLEFGASRKKKRKDSSDLQSFNKKLKSLSKRTFPEYAIENPFFAIQILNELYQKKIIWGDSNYYLKDTNSLESCPTSKVAIVYGVGPSSPAGSHSMIRSLNTTALIEVNRQTQLRSVGDYSTFVKKNSMDIDRHYLNLLVYDKPNDVHFKYWDQRYRIFSRFDEGVLLDAESWYSITFEDIGNYLAEHCISAAQEANSPLSLVWDCFSGCGGSSIPFCIRGIQLKAIDFDPVKLRYLRNNCEKYGSSDTLTTECSDVWLALQRVANQNLYLKMFKTLRKVVPSIRNTHLESFVPFHGAEIHELIYNSLSERERSIDEDPERGFLEFEPETSSSNSLNVIHNESNETAVGKNKDDNVSYIDVNLLQEGTQREGEKSENYKEEDVALSTDAGIRASPLDLETNQSDPIPKKSDKSIDLLIMSPPWGGPEYLNVASYDISTMFPCGDGMLLGALVAAASRSFVYIVPRNTEDSQLRSLGNIVRMPCRIENISMDGRVKVKFAYYGDIVGHL